MPAAIPPELARVIEDMETLAGAEPRYEADVRLICERWLRLNGEAAGAAARIATDRGHPGAAEGFGAIARHCRAAAARIAAPVPLRLVQRMQKLGDLHPRGRRND